MVEHEDNIKMEHGSPCSGYDSALNICIQSHILNMEPLLTGFNSLAQWLGILRMGPIIRAPFIYGQQNELSYPLDISIT
jgi:hypothetical protein